MGAKLALLDLGKDLVPLKFGHIVGAGDLQYRLPGRGRHRTEVRCQHQATGRGNLEEISSVDESHGLVLLGLGGLGAGAGFFFAQFHGGNRAGAHRQAGQTRHQAPGCGCGAVALCG